MMAIRMPAVSVTAFNSGPPTGAGFAWCWALILLLPLQA